MDIKEQILTRFHNTDSGGAGGRNGMTHREKILLNIALDVFSENTPVNDNINFGNSKSTKDYEFNMHQHWNDELKTEDDGHGGTIKHFQD